MNNVKNITHLFQEWVSASKAHNIEKMMSIVTEDVKITSPVFGNYKGKQEANKFWQKLYYAFPDFNMNLVTSVANKSRVMAEIDISGTHKRELDNKPAFGYKFFIRGVFVIDFDEDEDSKICEFKTYYDSGQLNRQLHFMKL
jgi:steroid delta-isomerase-like uncharacterized protein